MEELARGTVVVVALQGMNPTLVSPQDALWVPIPACPGSGCSTGPFHVPTLTRCTSCVAQTDGGLCTMFWYAHLMPKGSTQEAGDLQPQVL